MDKMAIRQCRKQMNPIGGLHQIFFPRRYAHSMLARRPSDVLDNLLSRFLQWSDLLSHLRSCERYDEPETLPYSIRPFCPMSADCVSACNFDPLSGVRPWRWTDCRFGIDRSYRAS